MRWLAGFLLLATFSPSQISNTSAQSTRAARGIKMTTQSAAEQTRQTGETSREETTFLQSDRSRTEYRGGLNAVHGDGTLDSRPGPRLASITRCDLGQSFELNLDDAEYVASPYPRFTLTEEQMEARLKETRMKARTGIVFYKVAPWVPTVRQERTTVDTGERKNFYGHEARHLISTRKTTPLAGSHFQPDEAVMDGWYIDLDTSISCEFRWPRHNDEPRHEYYAVGGERYEVIDDGTRETGFAIERKGTSRSIDTLPDGTKRPTAHTWEGKITEFYEGPLDPALFEVPGDFRKVHDLRRQPPMTLADRWYLASGWVKSLFK